eukprot:COSAG01_NODE_35227_length_535_cov_0.653670_1_plen_135_part_10
MFAGSSSSDRCRRAAGRRACTTSLRRAPARRGAGERAEALLSGDYPSQLEARRGDSQCGKQAGSDRLTEVREVLFEAHTVPDLEHVRIVDTARSGELCPRLIEVDVVEYRVPVGADILTDSLHVRVLAHGSAVLL